MPVHKKALERLEGSTFTPNTIVQFVNALGGMLDVTGAVTSQIHLDYQDKGDEIGPDDLIPFITIGLRPATEVEQVQREEATDAVDS